MGVGCGCGVRFCARVKARFSSTGFRFKKVVLETYNPYTEITNKNKKTAAFSEGRAMNF